jgi:hypothetical protein
VRVQVRDALLVALGRLDDSAEAWDALVAACRTGQAPAAAAAVGNLLATRRGSTPELLARLRSLPWERPAVLKEVARMLGRHAPLWPP